MPDALSTEEALKRVRAPKPLSTAEALAAARGQGAPAAQAAHSPPWAGEPGYQAYAAQESAKRRAEDPASVDRPAIPPVTEADSRAAKGHLFDATLGPVIEPMREHLRRSAETPDKEHGYTSGGPTKVAIDTMVGATTLPFHWAMGGASPKVGEAIEYPFKKMREGVNYKSSVDAKKHGISQETADRLFPGGRMIPGTQDAADAIGAPDLAPVIDLVALKAMHSGGKVGLEAVAETPGGKAFAAGRARGRAVKLEAAKPAENAPTEYDMERSNAPRPVALEAAEASRGPVRLKPIDGIVTAEEIAKLRAETKLAQMPADEMGMHKGAPGGPRGNMPIEETPQTRPELFDDMGVRRTSFGGGRGMGSQGGALRLPDPGKIGEFVGGMERRLGGGTGVPLETAAAAAKPKEPAGVESRFAEKIGNLKNYSPEMFNAAKDILAKKDRRTAGATRDMTTEWAKMPKAEAERVTVAMMEGREAATPAQTAFRDWWWENAKKLRQEFTEAGVRVTDKAAPGGYRPIGQIADFFPQQPLPEVLEQLKTDPTMRQKFYGEAAKQGLDRAAAEEMLQHYNEPGIKSHFAGIEQARKFKWPDEWRNPDVKGTLEGYLRPAYADAVEHDVLNYRDKATGAPRNVGRDGEIQGDLGDMLAKLPREQQASAKRLMLDILGRDPEAWDPTHQKSIRVANRIGAVNALRLYSMRPTTALVQLTQNAMTNALAGEVSTAKAIVRVTRDIPGAYDRAVRAGAVDSMSRFAETTGVLEEGAGAAVGKGVQTVTNVATFPMAATDMFSRLVASETAPDVAMKLHKQLNGNAWRQRMAAKTLEALDYPPEAADMFRRGDLTPEQMDIFRQRVVERTQGKVTNATRTPFASDSMEGRIFMQGKNFGVAQTRNTWRIAGKQLFQAYNLIPAARLVVGSYLLGKGIIATKDALVGPSENRPDDALTALQQGSLGGVAGDLAYAGVKGDTELRKTIDNLSEAQFKGLLEDLVSAVGNQIKPPIERTVPFGVAGMSVKVPKDRWTVFLDSLQRAAPSEREWHRIYDHFAGDDSIRMNEAGKRGLARYRKAKQVTIEAVR